MESSASNLVVLKLCLIKIVLQYSSPEGQLYNHLEHSQH